MSSRAGPLFKASPLAGLVPVLALLVPVGSARAEATHAVNGVFCTTEMQLDQVLVRLQAGAGPGLAVELGNEQSVACVWADLISYVITRPIIIGSVFLGAPLLKYEATLIGVIVGGTLRPVEPPTRIFFVRHEQLADSRLAT